VSSTRAATLILIGLVGAVALAGCGSSDEVSDEDYVAELQAVAVSLGEGADELSQQISNFGELSLASAGELLQTFSERVSDLAAKIEDVTPPAAIEDLHAQLVARLEGLASKAQAAALTLKAGDLIGSLPALTGFAAEATDAGGSVDSTVTEIQAELGID
jgi:hypothetical protein